MYGCCCQRRSPDTPFFILTCHPDCRYLNNAHVLRSSDMTGIAKIIEKIASATPRPTLQAALLAHGIPLIIILMVCRFAGPNADLPWEAVNEESSFATTVVLDLAGRTKANFVYALSWAGVWILGDTLFWGLLRRYAGSRSGVIWFWSVTAFLFYAVLFTAWTALWLSFSFPDSY
jgi:hypothetical protein